MTLSQLLDRPEKWTQDCSARDKYDSSLSTFDEGAVSRCLFGGVRFICKDDHALYEAYNQALNQAAKELFPERCEGNKCYYINFNDCPETSFEDVTRVIKRAEEILKEKSK